jgi:hypothetical protein
MQGEKEEKATREGSCGVAGGGAWGGKSGMKRKALLPDWEAGPLILLPNSPKRFFILFVVDKSAGACIPFYMVA